MRKRKWILFRDSVWMDFIILVLRVFLCLVVYPSFVHIQNIMCMSFVQATVSLMSCLFYRANCKNFQQRKTSRVRLFLLQAWNQNNPVQNCCEDRIWWCLPVRTTTNKHNQQSQVWRIPDEWSVFAVGPISTFWNYLSRLSFTAFTSVENSISMTVFFFRSSQIITAPAKRGHCLTAI